MVICDVLTGFFGVLAHFQTATTSFMFVRPSVFRMEKLGSHWMDFYEI
jgi:hypothetical protein